MTKLHSCQLCPRLTAFRQQQKIKYPDYHCLPVGAFGDPEANLLIVGLAPGLHGANASGRPFTGDAAGELLFKTLFRFGFANQAESKATGDNMRLINCRITNAVKCLPPKNRPNAQESRRCNRYLRDEMASLKAGAVILALGGLAHRSILMALALPPSALSFGHLAERKLDNGIRIIDSYHCSRYNLNTGRLTESMFERVFSRICEVIG